MPSVTACSPPALVTLELCSSNPSCSELPGPRLGGAEDELWVRAAWGGPAGWAGSARGTRLAGCINAKLQEYQTLAGAFQ